MRTIVFCGGGTAGHVMPNLALIEALSGEYNCVYVGGGGMEKELCESRGIPFYGIDTVKLRRGSVIKNIAVPFRLPACVRKAKRVLKEIKPDLVFSKGGYAALPVVMAARCKIIAHESDLTPGLVTTLSRRRAVKILCAFEPCAARFKNGVYTGTPLSRTLYRDKKRGNKPTLLVMGGSSGAETLNRAVTDALPDILSTFDVIHITGKNKTGGTERTGYTRLEFCGDMPSVYAASDIALTRGGANALAELTALRIPALCVPLEKASRGDQLQNVRYYENKGAVKVLRESELSGRSVIDGITAVYREREKMASAMSGIRVDGLNRICEIIRKCLG